MGAMDNWSVLFDILILLLAALILGVVCERLRQSPILGYLAAGTLLGPNALQFISSREVSVLAELGVALLWRRGCAGACVPLSDPAVVRPDYFGETLGISARSEWR
jgi:hypothetical protein